MNVHQISSRELDRYSEIPIAYDVNTIFEPVVTEENGCGILLSEVPCSPYIKDYDVYEDSRPTAWPLQFDTKNWGIFVAVDQGLYVGGAAVGCSLFAENKETAVLWDIRVRPEFRGRGVGTDLISSVERWARTRKCSRLFVETQNVNVPACKFYAKHGFKLASIDLHAYQTESLKHEAKLVWAKTL